MNTNNNIKTYSSVLQEAEAAITPAERAAFDLSFSISEKLYKTLKEKGLTKRDLARLTGKRESEVSRWFSFGYNFTCKTLATISSALNTNLVSVN